MKFLAAFSKTLNLAAEGILPGDECVVTGCYEDYEYTGYTLDNISCTIPRKLNNCTIAGASIIKLL